MSAYGILATLPDSVFLDDHVPVVDVPPVDTSVSVCAETVKTLQVVSDMPCKPSTDEPSLSAPELLIVNSIASCASLTARRLGAHTFTNFTLDDLEESEPLADGAEQFLNDLLESSPPVAPPPIVLGETGIKLSLVKKVFYTVKDNKEYGLKLCVGVDYKSTLFREFMEYACIVRWSGHDASSVVPTGLGSTFDYGCGLGNDFTYGSSGVDKHSARVFNRGNAFRAIIPNGLHVKMFDFLRCLTYYQALIFLRRCLAYYDRPIWLVTNISAESRTLTDGMSADDYLALMDIFEAHSIQTVVLHTPKKGKPNMFHVAMLCPSVTGTMPCPYELSYVECDPPVVDNIFNCSSVADLSSRRVWAPNGNTMNFDGGFIPSNSYVLFCGGDKNDTIVALMLAGNTVYTVKNSVYYKVGMCFYDTVAA